MSYIPEVGYVVAPPVVGTATGNIFAGVPQTHTPINLSEAGLVHRIRIEVRLNAVGGAPPPTPDDEFRLVVDGVNGDWFKIRYLGYTFSDDTWLSTFFTGSGDGTTAGHYRELTNINTVYQSSFKVEVRYSDALDGPPAYRIFVFRSKRVS